MVKVIKSAVKCYKKKTKKTVGGKRKIYEYNQYLVPLKRSDNFECSEDVFIMPQSEILELVGEDLSLAEEYLKNIGTKDNNIDAYERELAELEWKHNELSKSYKELVTKHTKTNKKLRVDNERINTLEDEKDKLMKNLKKLVVCIRLSKIITILKPKKTRFSRKNSIFTKIRISGPV